MDDDPKWEQKKRTTIALALWLYIKEERELPEAPISTESVKYAEYILTNDYADIVDRLVAIEMDLSDED